MKENEAQLVLGTLRVALGDAARAASGTGAGDLLDKAAGVLGAGFDAVGSESFIPGLQAGSSCSERFRVKKADTAAEMGHPDPSVDVLGSPRIALWFEITASCLLPEPDGEMTHVGTGILVHHLAAAAPGEEVTVKARLEEVEGRRVAFSLEARVGDRLVALGAHQRIVLSKRAL